VIYGDDNRLDYYQVTDTHLLKLSQSVAVMIDKADVVLKGDLLGFKWQTLPSKNICENEKFSKQNSIGNCTGFLISEDILLTAGHCVSEKSCEENFWVFDYYLTSANDYSPVVKRESVVECQRVLQSEFIFASSSEITDYAVIKLKHKIKDRASLELDFNFRNQLIKMGQMDRLKLGTWGFPLGLPMKWTAGGDVLFWDPSQDTILSNLDGFTGNSGGPIFDLATKKVIGIYSAGPSDLIRNEEKGCFESRIISNPALGLESIYLLSNQSRLGKFLQKN
jgi:V8-like Glu-specific endopeptidase